MNIKNNKKQLPPKQREDLLKALKVRFEKNVNRHKGLDWAKVQARLEANAEKLWSLAEMERTGGEPDVVGVMSGEYIFFDCSEQTPEGRVSLCYDREALDGRKENKPKSSVMDMAAAMGIEVLTEEQYLELQKLGEFDTKRSAGLKRRLISENSTVRCIVIAVMAACLSVTTARNLTTAAGDSVAR